MKRVTGLLGLIGFTFTLYLFSSTPAAADSELIVDDNLVECPAAGFMTIQAAVDAAGPGAKIRVCPGTYNEQVTINKPLRIIGDNGAVVKRSGMTANTTSLSTGAPISAAILVKDTTEVTIRSLTVDGANNGITGCGPRLIGIFYRNASGKIEDVAVRNMKLGAGLEGCQSGLGIFVQSGGGSSNVEVKNSSVHDFQKNGITGNEPGTDIRVTGNVVTGIGPTTGAAQNGIQIGFGAKGRIDENTVANHIWSPCVSISVCAFVATDLLIFSANDVRITENTVGKSQVGIFLQGNNGKVEGNNVFDTDVFDGIELIGNNNKVENNNITNSDGAAIFIDGNNNKITGNKINEASIGVLKAAGSVGNIIDGNRFVNTPTPVMDPPRPPEGQPTPFR
ncbi:hypothetical protein EPO44_18190 [bacterium]|nr:MAG: hypothetical protein EPO44_18190 [bacterium]